MGNQSSNEISQAQDQNTCRAVGGIYSIGKLIGRGNFGEVFIGYHRQKKELFAVKLESQAAPDPSLYKEVMLYKKVSKYPGFARIYYFGTCGPYQALVMDLLGPNMEELLGDCGGKFSVKTVLLIAKQALRLIERVHYHGLVYCDIKPQNFLLGKLGSPEQNILHIVDFGLSYSYLNSDKQHIAFSDRNEQLGTPRYMSINAHLGIQQSRRDDIEALGYMFLYFLRGHLPWMSVRTYTIKDQHGQISNHKRNTDLEHIYHEYPPEFVTFVNYARALDFYATPDYKYLHKLFSAAMNRLEYKNDNIYDWSELDLSHHEPTYNVGPDDILEDKAEENAVEKDQSKETPTCGCCPCSRRKKKSD